MTETPVPNRNQSAGFAGEGNNSCNDCPTTLPTDNIFWNNTISECLASLGVTNGITLTSIINILGSAICTLQGDIISSITCSVMTISQDYQGGGIGFNHLGQFGTYNIPLFSATSFTGTITIDGIDYSIHMPLTDSPVPVATFLPPYLIALNVGTVSIVSSSPTLTFTITGFHTFGNIILNSVTYNVTETLIGSNASLCNLLSEINLAFQRQWSPADFDWHGVPVIIPSVPYDAFDAVSMLAEESMKFLYYDSSQAPAEQTISGTLSIKHGTSMQLSTVGVATSRPRLIWDADFINFTFISPAALSAFVFSNKIAVLGPTLYDYNNIPTGTSTFDHTHSPIYYIDKTAGSNIIVNFPVIATELLDSDVMAFVAIQKNTVATHSITFNAGSGNTISGAGTFNFAPSTVNYLLLQAVGTDWRVLILI